VLAYCAINPNSEATAAFIQLSSFFALRHFSMALNCRMKRRMS